MLKRTVQENSGVIMIRAQASNEVTEYPSITQIPELWWFLIGNLFYSSSGLVLAAVLKDNRAFCKYVCPIAVFLKLGARFSLVKIKETAEGCDECGICEKNCPMDIRIREYTRNRLRVGATECIICKTCISSCPKKVLGLSIGFDMGRADYLNRTRP